MSFHEERVLFACNVLCYNTRRHNLWLIYSRNKFTQRLLKLNVLIAHAKTTCHFAEKFLYWVTLLTFSELAIRLYIKQIS